MKFFIHNWDGTDPEMSIAFCRSLNIGVFKQDGKTVVEFPDATQFGLFISALLMKYDVMLQERKLHHPIIHLDTKENHFSPR